MGAGDGYAAATSAAGRACLCPTQVVVSPCSSQPGLKRQQQKIGVHSLWKCSFVLQLVFLLLTYATLPGVSADDVSCQQPPSLSLEAQKPADQCQGSLDGSSTRIITNLTYTASMTGNGDTAPIFETFFDGEASSCEPEVVVERSMDGFTQSGVVFVSCQGSFTEGPHSLQVTALFDNGMPGCGGVFRTISTTAVVIGPPSIRLAKAQDAELCFGSKQFVLSFPYEKSESVRGLAMGYTVTVNGQDRSMCSAAESGAGVTVTCSTDDAAGFVSGTYDVTLAAYLLEQGAVSVCKQELATTPVTTRISVKARPIVNLRHLEPTPVCLGARTATAQFEYWVDNAGNGAQVAAIQPLGQVVAPGTLAALSTDCTSTLEASSATTGKLTVTCGGNFGFVNGKWNVKATIAATCNGVSALNSDPAVAAAAAAAEPDAVSTNATAATEGAASAVELTAAPAAAVTGSLEITVPLSCCISGSSVMAFARSRVGVTPASRCFRPKVPGSGNNKVCSLNHGFWNRGPMPLGRMWVVPQPPASVKQPTCSRPGGFKVGDVIAECVPQGGRLPDLMNITLVTSKYNDPRRRTFVFSCDPPGAGGCTTKWESPEFVPSWVDEESGLKISSFQTEPPAKCKCKDMYWAVRELGVYRDSVPMGLCKDTARAP